LSYPYCAVIHSRLVVYVPLLEGEIVFDLIPDAIVLLFD